MAPQTAQEATGRRRQASQDHPGGSGSPTPVSTSKNALGDDAIWVHAEIQSKNTHPCLSLSILRARHNAKIHAGALEMNMRFMRLAAGETKAEWEDHSSQ